MNKRMKSNTFVTADPIGSSGARPPRGPGASVPTKVLVVDDSTVIQKTYKVFLNRYRGCQVINADNGRAAISQLSENPDVDLILLDLNMPIMGGIEFLEVKRKQNKFKHIPVIIITTEDMGPKAVEAMQKGARGYIVKPFTADTLYALIQKLFNG